MLRRITPGFGIVSALIAGLILVGASYEAIASGGDANIRVEGTQQNMYLEAVALVVKAQ